MLAGVTGRHDDLATSKMARSGHGIRRSHNDSKDREVNERYFLRLGGPWREVSKEEFVTVEHGAGFRRKDGRSDEPATGGFSGFSGAQGRIVYAVNTKDQYAWDPEFATVAFGD
jgi:hypothetical protein